MARRSNNSFWGSYTPKPKIEAGTGIRAAKSFGTTWWGAEWLEAFNHISDSNRLPRGRTYARNGSVRSISINGNKITASVQGSRLYKILIEIPEFTKAQTAAIAEVVADRPDLLSSLLNRELPPELDDACKQVGVHIFPSRWRDLKATCSCPDSAMPCKHLAAIIYLISNEIDKNPFVVFDLHGFDLIDALQKAGFAAVTDHKAEILPYKSLWEKADKKNKNKDRWSSTLAESLDFSRIPEMRNQLLTILSDKPVFYPEGDFKQVLSKAWTKIAKFSSAQNYALYEDQKAQKARDESDVDQQNYEQAENICLKVNATGLVSKVLITDAKGQIILKTPSLGSLFAWLEAIPYGRLAHLSPDVAALWHIKRFAELCSQKSALVPQAIDYGAAGLGVRWLPALLQPDIRAIFEILEKITPKGLLLKVGKKKEKAPIQTDYLLQIIAVFIQFYVENGFDLDGKIDNIPVNSVFFNGEKTNFTKFEDKEYPNAIQLWLNRFYISEKETVPVLAVEEEGEDQLAVTLLIEKRGATQQAPVPLKELLTAKKHAASRLDILRDLSTLGSYFEGIKQLVANKGKVPLLFSTQDFAAVLFEKLPIIRLFGIKVLLPKALNKIIRPSLSMHISAPTDSTVGSSAVSLKNLLAYRWEIALGDKNISEAEFYKMVKDYSGLVKIRDEYVFFDQKEIESLAARLAKPPKMSGMEILLAALAEDFEGTPIQLSNEARVLMEELKKQELLDTPENLQATLRPYQHRGYSWMIKNAKLGFGSILADDMGLGKTLQVITAFLQFKNEGLLSSKNPALVIVPTTLITNWQREIAKFAPDLSTAIYHGPKRDIKTLKSDDIVLTSYGVVRSDVAKLNKIAWSVVAIDEAQNIKNPASAQTKAVKKIKADNRIAMSGTPVENRLSEYWSISDFANNGLLGAAPYFKKEFAQPIEGQRDQYVLHRFRKVTEPFVLRRLKTDKSIISDLPDKIQQDQFCTLTTEQAALYEKTVQTVLEKIKKSEGIERKGLVLALIMSLKQICNHPTHFLKKGAPDPNLSGKMPLLLDLVRQALENDEKTLIFTQFREMGELLSTMLQQEFGFETPFLHGGLSRKQRDLMVEDFQEKRQEKVLILSLKAGGTGLNLTAASQVVHFDLWWNPAVEAQATDRAFRIGQKKNVQVHRFITQATFEERINEMLIKKRALADLSVSSGEHWIGDLSDGELGEVFGLGSDK